MALAVLTEDAEAAAAIGGWRWCGKCQALFRGKGTESVGVCPKGGAHKPVAGYNYLLLFGLTVTDGDLIKPWFQCQKCRGLFAPEGSNNGNCPKGGAHKRTGPEYAVWKGTALPFMEPGWWGCTSCFALF